MAEKGKNMLLIEPGNPRLLKKPIKGCFLNKGAAFLFYIGKQNIFAVFFCISKLFCIFAPEMRIVSHRRLVEFYCSEGHADSQAALERWYDIAERAVWRNLADIKADFPATDYVGNQHYVFNIRGNRYRLVVVVKFTIGHIFIRFVGTHGEYDRIDASTI